MMDTILETIPKTEALLNDFFYILIYLIIFAFGFALFALIRPYKLHEELVEKKNAAVALSLMGYLLGVSAVYVAVLSGPSQGLWEDILSVSGYSALGILFMILSSFLSDKVIFSKYSVSEELARDKNMGMASAQSGLYFATGLIAASSVYGSGGSWLSSVVFFVLGQTSLILFAKIYKWITPYRVFEEIEKDNVAVGVAYSGNVVALGLILNAALSGNFVGWVQDITLFVFYSLGAFVLFPLVHFVLDRFILFRFRLDHEISENKNIAVAFIEFAVMVGTSAVFFVFIK